MHLGLEYTSVYLPQHMQQTGHYQKSFDQKNMLQYDLLKKQRISDSSHMVSHFMFDLNKEMSMLGMRLLMVQKKYLMYSMNKAFTFR